MNVAQQQFVAQDLLKLQVMIKENFVDYKRFIIMIFHFEKDIYHKTQKYIQ